MITKDDINVPAIKERATRIITSPQSEWRVIEPEPTTVEKLYKGYIVPLAAIPVVANFLGSVLIGAPFVGRASIPYALVVAVLTYAASLASCYIAAIIVSKLAPTFESVSDDRQALKLVAYSMTPVWIAGVLNILPLLWIFGLLAGLYAIYLFYLGIPVMMKTPEAKVVPYMAVSAVVVIAVTFVLYLVIGMIAGSIFLASSF